MNRAIFLITGVMASGKSTTAQLLAERINNCVHLRGDEFRRMIISGRVEMTAQPSREAIRQLHLRYRMATDAAKTYYENGFSVVMQDNFYGADLTRVLGMLEGYPVNVIVLCPNAKAVAQRERTRGKTGYIDFTVEDEYAVFISETPRIGLWLDTSNQTPEQSVKEIMLHFGLK